MKNLVLICCCLAIIPLVYFYFLYTPNNCQKYQQDLVDEIQAKKVEIGQVQKAANQIYKDDPKFAKYNAFITQKAPLKLNLTEGTILIACGITEIQVPTWQLFTEQITPDQTRQPVFQIFDDEYVLFDLEFRYFEINPSTNQTEFEMLVLFGPKRDSTIKVEGGKDTTNLEIQIQFIQKSCIVKIRPSGENVDFQTVTLEQDSLPRLNPCLKSFRNINNVVIKTPFTQIND